MEQQHTPTPWHMHPAEEDFGTAAIHSGVESEEQRSENIADCYSYTGLQKEETNANAAFIIRAVNCHDELLEALSVCAEALEAARDKLGICGWGDGKDRKADASDDIGCVNALHVAYAAIAKVEQLNQEGNVCHEPKTDQP